MFPSFISYNQFLETGTDPGTTPHLKIHETDHIFQDDLYPDSEMMKKKTFVKGNYPTNLQSANIFCPFCGKEVEKTQHHLTYESTIYQRKFLTHESCLSQNSSEFLNDVFDQVDEMKILPFGLTKKMKTLSIGERQFCIQLMVTHPLSNLKFIKLVSKGSLEGNTIRWYLRQDEELFCYLPNIICFPFTDFKVNIVLSEIGSENKTQFTSFVNLSRNKTTSKTLTAQSEQLTLQLKIHETEEEKKKIINEMNYKYKYRQSLPLPIVEFTALEIELPEQEDGDDEESNSTIVELLSETNSIASSVHSSMHSSIHSAVMNSVMNSSQSYNMMSYGQKINEKSPTGEKQKIEIEKLILNGQLSSYVRNNVQSRLFQEYLEKVTEQQIQIIIKNLEEEFRELVVDQYANYMMQKLFSVCSHQQRVKIIKKLASSIPNIVKNKQGTHTIQAFISFFIERQEFDLAQMVCMAINEDFQKLSTHPFSTHFVQSIVKIFPVQNILGFFMKAQKSFLEFAVDKNAMCVLKHIIKRISKEENNPIIVDVKKNLINSITLNTDKIIQDCFGNYVIQFCYEYFGEAKSSGITEMIIEKFVQFSLQKYSSSVVSKCISTYWKDKNCALKLKEVLKPEGITEMFRSREGNKILLDLLENYEHTPLRDKLINSLPLGESSKHFHERWQTQFWVKSGPVGYHAKNFSQADNIHKKSRKK